jgi:hypothetical protein
MIQDCLVHCFFDIVGPGFTPGGSGGSVTRQEAYDNGHDINTGGDAIRTQDLSGPEAAGFELDIAVIKMTAGNGAFGITVNRNTKQVVVTGGAGGLFMEAINGGTGTINADGNLQFNSFNGDVLLRDQFLSTSITLSEAGELVLNTTSNSLVGSINELVAAIAGLPAPGQDNTSSNAGASGEGLALAKVGVDLPFKKLIAGANVTLTPSANAVTVAATAGAGESNTSSNAGASGEGLALAKVGVNLPFKRLIAGANVTLTPSADAVTIAATGGGGGITRGIPLFSYTTGSIDAGQGSNNTVWFIKTAALFSMECDTIACFITSVAGDTITVGVYDGISENLIASSATIATGALSQGFQSIPLLSNLQVFGGWPYWLAIKASNGAVNLATQPVFNNAELCRGIFYGPVGLPPNMNSTFQNNVAPWIGVLFPTAPP